MTQNLNRLPETEGTIDAGTIIHYTGMTPAGVRKWLKRHGIHPIGRGKYNRFLYRTADVYPLIANHQKNQ